ncbi:MAG: hypothetical protein MI746_06930 [Pseudomonadales bacterium]|nr:hypothetical protein [Pseudomonadales bacterium]
MNTVQNAIIILFLTAAASSSAFELYGSFPSEIHPDQKYVFYSHGLIVEGTNPRPVHPEFGIYEFPLIVETLFEGGEFNLIAHHRPARTDPEEYSEQLATWVQDLVNAGVQPKNVTLIGFSRGAQITLKASDRINSLGVNTAVMAVCFDGDFPTEPPIRLAGNVLSIYETSDVVKSCREILKRSDKARSTREIAISTGLEHGAFYTPQPQWMAPLKAWLSDNDR